MPRVFQYHAGDGKPLLFAAREPVAAVAHDGIVAFRQIDNKVMYVGGAARCTDLIIAGLGPGIEQVCPDGIVEQVSLLRHHADLPRQSLQAQVADIVSVDADGAAVRVVEARQQIADRGLAGPAGANQRGQLARLDLKAYVFQCPARLAVRVVFGLSGAGPCEGG